MTSSYGQLKNEQSTPSRADDFQDCSPLWRSKLLKFCFYGSWVMLVLWATISIPAGVIPPMPGSSVGLYVVAALCTVLVFGLAFLQSIYDQNLIVLKVATALLTMVAIYDSVALILICKKVDKWGEKQSGTALISAAIAPVIITCIIHIVMAIYAHVKESQRRATLVSGQFTEQPLRL
jgi:hypothetical protein